MFRLTKLAIDDGEFSLVPSGYVTEAPECMLFDSYDRTRSKRVVEKLSDVEAGWQLVVSSFTRYHNTSHIREIVSCDDKTVVFKTQTSLYKLEKLDE